MTKSIQTLVKDINAVLEKNGGWTEFCSSEAAKEIETVLNGKLVEPDHTGGTLRMSNIGTPCQRKLWFEVNQPAKAIPLDAASRFKFLYGDIIETLVLHLARAAGHTVEGEQDLLEINGIKGHRDAVIDGITVDVKSCSPSSFKKFANGDLRKEDPFGYVSQLSSYVYASSHRGDSFPVNPTLGAFLAVDKVNGTICLDMYDFTRELKVKEKEIDSVRAMVKQSKPPIKYYDDVPYGKSGNRVLPFQCGFCNHKHNCWDKLRTFRYANGQDVYFTKVTRTPNVQEIK